MKSLSIALATAGIVSGVALSVAPASAAPTCADPIHPISGVGGFEVTVGTTKVKKIELRMVTGRGCDVDTAVATVTSPSKSYRVVLHREAPQPDLPPGWSGSLRLDPKDLRNVDAGAWKVHYEVTGQADDSADNVGHVRRATRMSFDAGPEPVRNGKITFSGKLERASWDSHRYRGLSRTITVQAFAADGVEEYDVVELKTRADGTFKTTTRFPGTNTYWANYDGDERSSNVSSRHDRVKAG